MAAAEKEEDREQNKDRCSFLNDNVSIDEWDVGKQVYFNDVIMRQVVSFVNDIKDRQKLELSSMIMNDLSSRVPYISYNNDNSILDMYFTRSRAGDEYKCCGQRFQGYGINIQCSVHLCEQFSFSV